MNVIEAVADYFGVNYDDIKEQRYGEKDEYPIGIFECDGRLYTATPKNKHPDDKWANWGDGTPDFNWDKDGVNSRGWIIWVHIDE